MSSQDEHATSARAPTIDTRRGYDLWASQYDEDGNPLISLEEEVFGDLVGDAAGKRVIDIGCGTGRHAIRLARIGADVVGVDFSEGMLERARSKAGDIGVRFVRHDIGTALPFGSASFELVMCCLVMDHIHELMPLFREMARLCRADGRIVMTVMHPAMSLRGVRARFIDPATGERVHLSGADNTIADYVNSAVGVGGAGLIIDHIGEYTPTDSVLARCPRAEPYRGWPMLLTMRLRRPGRPG